MATTVKALVVGNAPARMVLFVNFKLNQDTGEVTSVPTYATIENNNQAIEQLARKATGKRLDGTVFKATGDLPGDDKSITVIGEFITVQPNLPAATEKKKA